MLDKRKKYIIGVNGIKVRKDKNLIPDSQFCAIRFNVQGYASSIEGSNNRQGPGKKFI